MISPSQPTNNPTPSSHSTRVAAPAATAPFPLTHVQREIWLACQLSPEMSCAYNETSVLTLRGPLNVVVLREALLHVVARHEAFRLTLAADGSGQQARPGFQLDVPLVDWSSLDAPAQAERLAAATATDMSTPFDLVQGPLIRARIIRLANEDHRLVICVHHLVCDGWTWSILQTELGQRYSAHLQSRPCVLPEPKPFSTFAAEHREQPEAEAYWLRQFAEPPPPLDLPFDHPRTYATVNRGAFAELRLGARLVQALRTTGARNGTSLFTVLLASLHVLLQRLSHQRQTVIAICSAGQSRPGAEQVAGHCVNLLPIYSNAAEDRPFTRHLADINDLLQTALEHQDYTYGQLMQKLAITREPGRPPLINAVLTFAPQADPSFAHLTVEEHYAPKSFVNFDLLFEIREASGGLILEVNYNRDLLEPATVQRWLGHFQVLLEGIAAKPGAALASLPLLDPLSRRQLLTEWNETALAHPPGCLHELFEQQVMKNPRADALVVGDERLTYAQLNRRANRIAHHLRSVGVGPECLVGIFMERSADMVCALLGVLKAGGAYVPLDPGYPADRITHMLDDSGALAVLTHEKLADKLRRFSLKNTPRIVNVDTDVVGDRETDLPLLSRPDHLAYVIYTSGSTGRPKGVALEHRNTVAFVHWAGVVFDSEQLNGVLASTSICFDLSVFELFVTLAHGGKIILAGNALDLPALPAADEVRLIVSVPSIIAELLRMQGIPTSVTTVTLAGEPLPVDTVKRLYALPHIHKVWDLYGPTETTTYSTFALRAPDQPATIGRPIANTQVYLLDESLQPVPIGVVGELFIGGHGVARGYLHQPELTAQKFIADPFSTHPGARLYRTGDLCRYRPDGNLDYLGRIDHQVKIRGVRIELGEIETALRAHPAIAESVVVAREDSPGNKRLVAYVSRHPNAAAEPEQIFVSHLRADLGHKLPQPMIPESFVVLDRLPLTPNGKLTARPCPLPPTPSLPWKHRRHRSVPLKKRSPFYGAKCSISRKSACMKTSSNSAAIRCSRCD